MQDSNIPVKVTVPWASGEGAGFVRTPPVPSQATITPGAASYTDGFPPLNFNPVASGGIPPFGQDMNGVLLNVTQWMRWLAAGGPLQWDSAFSAAIGGYPLGSRILSTSGHAIWQSTVDNNVTNPDAAGAGWIVASSAWSSTTWVAAGSSNIQTLTLAPVPASLAQLVGITLVVKSVGINSGSVTLNVNGLGAKGVVAGTSGLGLAQGALQTGFFFEVVYDGTQFQLTSGLDAYLDPGSGGFTIAGASGNGANLLLAGNGVTTPNKFIRAANSFLDVVNSAYTAVIMRLTDLGDLSFIRNLTTTGNVVSGGVVQAATSVTAANGNVLAQNGRLRATFGAFASGDANAGTILADFAFSNAINGWERLPNGRILQWGLANSAGGNPDFFNFNIAFVSGCESIVGADDGNGMASSGASPINLSQFEQWAGFNNATGSAPFYSAGIGIRWIAVGF